MAAGLGGLVAVAVVALVVLNVGAPAGMVAGSGGLGALGVKNSLGGSLGVKLVVQVHRVNGTTVTYTKEGDLVLLNFAKLLVKAIVGQNDPDGDDDFMMTKGVAAIGTNSIGATFGRFWLGDDPAPSVSLTDYNFTADIVFNVQDGDITISGNNMTIDIFGSYTVDTAFNVTEVGLVMPWDSVPDWVLLFHDVLPSPIQLNAGDGITVHYYIIISNP